MNIVTAKELLRNRSLKRQTAVTAHNILCSSPIKITLIGLPLPTHYVHIMARYLEVKSEIGIFIKYLCLSGGY